MIKIARGFHLYFSGIGYWFQKKPLLWLSIVPFILDAICLSAGLTFTALKLPLAVSYLLAKPSIWYQYFLYYFVFVITGLTLFFLAIFVVSIFANLLAGVRPAHQTA